MVVLSNIAITNDGQKGSGEQLRYARNRVFPFTPLGLLLLAMAFFYVWPIIQLIGTSISWSDLSYKIYAEILQKRVYRTVIWNTIKISALVTLCSVGVGFLYALFLSKLNGLWAKMGFGVAVLPIVVNPLAIIFAWTILLERHGLVNKILNSLGVVESPLTLCYNLFSVLLVMTYLLFPFVVLPCYAAFLRIKWDLKAAARNLGAGRFQVFMHIEMPVCIPAIVTGASLVFVLALGYFITPALLGSSSETMISMMIAEYFNVLLDWQTGSSLSLILLGLVLITLAIKGLFGILWQRKRIIS